MRLAFLPTATATNHKHSLMLSLTCNSVWYLNSATASHMTPSEGILSSKTTYSGPTEIQVGTGTLLPIKNIGTMYIHTISHPLVLNPVCHVLMFKHNLLSINQLCRDSKVSVIFDSTSFPVKDNYTGTVILRGSSQDHFYPL